MNNLDHATFAQNLNTAFKLRINDSNNDSKTVELLLVEVSDLRESNRNRAFSLLFRGPREFMLPQYLYTLEHEQIGTCEIFITPVGMTEEGYKYEAVFNRLKENVSN